MTIREQIISQLDVPNPLQGNYDKLKKSLVHYVQTSIIEGSEDTDLDPWFKGVIESLFYKPNHCMLVLEGKKELDLKSFFGNLFPVNSAAYPISHCSYKENIADSLYDSIILNFDFSYKKEQDLIEEDNFKIIPENCKNLIHPGTDKRLCSYCSTTEKWRYPQRKNVIVLPVLRIDWELYNSINKLGLWQELFAKFTSIVVE